MTNAHRHQKPKGEITEIVFYYNVAAAFDLTTEGKDRC